MWSRIKHLLCVAIRRQFIFLVPDHDLNLPSAPELDEGSNLYRGLKSYKAYHRCARHAVWRAAQMGVADERERVRLEEVALRWSREVERLERLADEEGFDAVLAWSRCDRQR